MKDFKRLKRKQTEKKKEGNKGRKRVERLKSKQDSKEKGGTRERKGLD